MTLVNVPDYEFHVYAATEDGVVSAEPIEIVHLHFMTVGQAKARARKFARDHEAPVDMYFAGNEPFRERYIGTANPRWPHSGNKTTVFERLD